MCCFLIGMKVKFDSRRKDLNMSWSHTWNAQGAQVSPIEILVET